MVGANYERKLRDKFRVEGWIVIRSAGSHVVDLVVLKPEEHMLVEVKSTSKDRVKTNINQKSKEQFDLLNEYAKQGFNVYYYVWFKGKRDGWKEFKLPLEPYPVFKYKKSESK